MRILSGELADPGSWKMLLKRFVARKVGQAELAHVAGSSFFDVLPRTVKRCRCVVVDGAADLGLSVPRGKQDPVPRRRHSGQEAVERNPTMSEFPGGDGGLPRHIDQRTAVPRVHECEWLACLSATQLHSDPMCPACGE